MNWLTRQQLDEERRQNVEAVERSIYGPYGFGVPRVVSRNPSTVVKRGATWEGVEDFIRKAEEACRRLTNG